MSAEAAAGHSSGTVPADAANMKCIHASALGTDVDKTFTMVTDAPRPAVDVKGGKKMLVKVEACSLSAGDCIMLSGDCEQMVRPPAYPFVPGMDICGIVEEVADSDTFKVGDRVFATNGMLPVGGLAEYIEVNAKWAAKAPAGLSAVEASALPNSPCAALHAVKAARIQPGERVLVCGGSGGVGSSILQLVKDAKASYLATTSTDEALCSSLGADRVINYRETNWYEDGSYKEQPFDVVIDCVGWRDEWKMSIKHKTLKPSRAGGRYIVIAFTDTPQMKTVWQGVKMFVPLLWRLSYTGLNRFVPRYKLVASEPTSKDLEELGRMVEAGRLKPVLESRSPFEFTLDGVKEAFRLQLSRRAHGKVVVRISS